MDQWRTLVLASGALLRPQPPRLKQLCLSKACHLSGAKRIAAVSSYPAPRAALRIHVQLSPYHLEIELQLVSAAVNGRWRLAVSVVVMERLSQQEGRRGWV